MPDTNPTRWQPDRSITEGRWPMPAWRISLWRGVRGICPVCGQANLFRGYLRVVDNCKSCEAPLGRVRADDLPPYLTIFVVGHIVVGLMLWVERAYKPSLWMHAAIWLPLTVVLSLVLIRPLKGLALGLMLKLGMMKSDDET
jgi:uncharacterized protein (DUF983 family)